MGRPVPTGRMTHAEYLAAEAKSDLRHEFVGGQVYAMAGGSPEHGALALAFGAELRGALRDRPCRVYSSDVRIRVLANDLASGVSTYPDLSVVCGTLATALDDPDAITNPVVLVEVLSESTEAYDRGAKAALYRRIPSLQEYVLVAQSEALIEVYRRTDRGSWELRDARPGDRIELVSLGIAMDVATIYANPLGQTGAP